MPLKQKNTNPTMTQNILVIAEHIEGAKKAALFATRNLTLHDSEMVLLQTYQKRSFGQSMLRNITPILEKTARHELSELKNQIVRNTGINPKSISKKVMEGELLSVLKQRFGHKAGIAMVLGLEQGMPYSNNYCKKLIVSLLKSGIKPLYIISNGITLISKDRVTYFSGEKNMQDSAYYQFTSRIFTGLGLKQSIVVSSADSHLKPEKNSVDLLNSNSWKLKDEYTLAEQLFRGLNEGRDDLAIQTVKQS
jgi:hypothetical protein